MRWPRQMINRQNMESYLLKGFYVPWWSYCIQNCTEDIVELVLVARLELVITLMNRHYYIWGLLKLNDSSGRGVCCCANPPLCLNLGFYGSSIEQLFISISNSAGAVPENAQHGKRLRPMKNCIDKMKQKMKGCIYLSFCLHIQYCF